MASARGRTLGRRILRAALARARELAAQRPGDVLAVGLGFKHSRTRGGYGLERRPCVKFFVRRKRRKGLPAGPLPSRVRFRTAGGWHSLPTDVEPIGHLTQHAAPVLRRVGQAVVRGTPTAVFRDADATPNDPTVYLMTAGHVFRGAPEGTAAELAGSGAVPVGNGTTVGGVVSAATYFLDGGGATVDVALVRVPDPSVLGPLLTPAPWSSPWSLVDQERLEDAVYAGLAPDLYLVGASGSKSLEFDAVAEPISDDPVELSVTTPNGTVEVVRYAPILLHLRAQKRKPIGGDSGAPILDDDDNLVGMHILGAARSVDDAAPGAERSMAILVEEAVRQIRVRTGLRLELIRAV